jgi:predicted DNA-binding transcriptional regulator AlpA
MLLSCLYRPYLERRGLAMSNTLTLYTQNEEQRFLRRKEMAYMCHVSLSTLNRGIRDGEWPFSAYIRISPRRVVYPVSILREIEERAGIQAR